MSLCSTLGYALLRFQRDHHRHELQNKDIQFLHIKLYTLFVHQTVHPTYMTENIPQKNLLNLCIGLEEPVLLPLVPLTHGAVGWLYVGFEEFDGSLNLECLR